MHTSEMYSEEWSPDHYMDAVALRINLQSMHSAAETSNALHMKSIEAGGRDDKTRFILYDLTHRMAPVDLAQIRRTPDAVSGVEIAGIAAIDIYYPTRDPEGKQPMQGWWNDVLIDLKRSDGSNERLLLNDAGLYAYELAEDLTPGDDREFTSNMLTIQPGRELQPATSFPVLQDVVYNYTLSGLTSDSL